MRFIAHFQSCFRMRGVWNSRARADRHFPKGFSISPGVTENTGPMAIESRDWPNLHPPQGLRLPFGKRGHPVTHLRKWAPLDQKQNGLAVKAAGGRHRNGRRPANRPGNPGRGTESHNLAPSFQAIGSKRLGLRERLRGRNDECGAPGIAGEFPLRIPLMKIVGGQLTTNRAPGIRGHHSSEWKAT